MEEARSNFLVLLLASMAVLCIVCAGEDGNLKKTTYIVTMDKGSKPESFAGDDSDWFRASLNSVSASANMVYTYKHALHGFAAKLSEKEAESLSLSPRVAGVVKQKKYHLHTTRTPEFLGLTSSRAEALLVSASDVIIGVIDTGVWPHHRSFNDQGLGPVPNRWKGGCLPGLNGSVCNRKLIGAKFFAMAAKSEGGFNDELSLLDHDGHGTHTMSTAGGAEVGNSSFLGFGQGTARGMATTARLAAYKVCWRTGCYNSDILAGIDEAIKDGVDILSISLGTSEPVELADDILAWGLLHATANGIHVVMSAGNSGPLPGTVDNAAPWITTVAASTLDRDFLVEVKLGNGKILTGTSLFRGNPPPANSPLILGKMASVNMTSGEFCFDEYLNANLTKGKIVVCRRGSNPRVSKGLAVKNAGGVGMILYNGPADGDDPTADAHIIPTAAVGFVSGEEVMNYVLTDRNPTATLGSATTVMGDKSAPAIGSFSSRGPSTVAPGVIKPDLTAPGINILAAWTALAPPTALDSDSRRVEFNIISGTSMSCPHASGLASLVKAKHPEWSPAAVRSALMTTAYYKHAAGNAIVDTATSEPTTPFDMGSGHVDVVSALDPGLIYDAGVDDYVKFICAMNLNPGKLLANVHFATNFSCGSKNMYSVGDLNYPSFLAVFPAKYGKFVVKQTRTLTSVVNGVSTYRVRVSEVIPAAPVEISVEPSSLTFEGINQKRSFTVTFTSSGGHKTSASFARLEWTDGKHTVSSPVALQWVHGHV